MADGRAHARLLPDPARPLGPGLRRMDRGFRRADQPRRPADRHRFFNVYAAGTLTWQGRSAEAYAPALQHAAEKAVFDDREVPFYGWHYPPFFFAIAVLVAAVPYVWGLTIWLVASFAGYLAA